MEQWPDTLQSCSQFIGSTLQLQFPVVKSHLNSSLSNCSLLGSLYHVKHALLKGPRTLVLPSSIDLWHCVEKAC